MCDIMWMKRGIVPPYEKFRNCVWNNPHGWGLVMRDNKRLEMRKDFKPEGTDPDELYKIISDNADVERFLHVRWATDGEKNLDNTQPFPVYSSGNRDIFFMHNGVLHEWKPPMPHAASYADDELRDASDSRRFAEMKLTDLLVHLKGANGAADLEDPIVQEILSKYWSTSSRGILIGSDVAPFLFNKNGWKEITFTEDGVLEDGSMGPVEKKFMSSNDDYFDRLSRGPEFERRQAAERAQREKEAARTSAFNRLPANSSSDNQEVEKLTSQTFQSRYQLKAGPLASLVNLGDIYDDNNVTVLSSLSTVEVEELMKEEPDAGIFLILFMGAMLRTYYENTMEAEKALESTQKAISRIKADKMALDNLVKDQGSEIDKLKTELFKLKGQKNGKAAKAA